MTPEDKILSLNDKIRLLARDIYDAAQLLNSLTIEHFVPSKQLQSILDEKEYGRLVDYLRKQDVLIQAWREIKKWNEPKDGFQAYKIIINQPNIRGLLGLKVNENKSVKPRIKSSGPVTASFSDEKIKYKLTYNPTERVLRLNGIPIAKPQYGSENAQFLSFFVAENNTGEQYVKTLLAFMNKDKLTKRPTQILGDLKIIGNIKTVFFPNASVRAIEYRNPITYTYAEKHELPEIDINHLAKTVRSSQK